MDSTTQEISKTYRQLARKWHPDVYKGDLPIEEATEMFQKVANAYEILSNEETRADYDYLLENPEAYYEHYYRFYRHRYAPKVDVRIVIVSTILIITVVQYVNSYLNYWTKIRQVAQVPRFRMQALNLAKERQIKLDEVAEEKTRDRAELKRRAKDYEERLVQHVLATTPEDVDIGLVTLLRPVKFEDTLLVQIVYLPKTLYHKFGLNYRYYISNKFLGNPLNEEDQLELIRINFGLPLDAWELQPESVKHEYLDLELWKTENFAQWKEEKEAESRRNLAQKSGRYRQAKRWEKAHANDRMTFED